MRECIKEKEHKKMTLSNDKFIPVLMEIGNIMYENRTDTVELELSTPEGTVLFEITMRLKEESEDDN